MLDETFRRRVRALAIRAEGDAPLDAESRERVVAAIVGAGPEMVVAAHRSARLRRLVFPMLAVAAAVAVFVGLRSERWRGDSSGVAAGAPVVGKACESRGANASVRFESDGIRRVLDMGSVAYAAAPATADVEVVKAQACRTELALSHGRVVVAARDLGGGRFVVRAGDTDVTVRGTLFAVSRRADSVWVEVAEGLVAVERKGELHEVSAGGKLIVSAVGVATSRLSETEAAELYRAVDLKPVVEIDALEGDVASGEERPRGDNVGAGSDARRRPRRASVRDSNSSVRAGSSVASVASKVVLDEANAVGQDSPGALLEMAEKLRRTGNYARARELYARVGGGSGVTAEAAWLGLARMELALGDALAARRATEQRRARFGAGALGPEARWIDVRIHRLAGDVARARSVARELLERWPLSPQADAARSWLQGRERRNSR